MELNKKSIEIENVDMKDYPDFCDAFISYAEWQDGTPLTDDELEKIDSETVNGAAYESLY
jgi:hypothetical protein